MQHLWKLISTFYKEHLEKPIMTFLLVDSALPIARPPSRPINKYIKALITKQKRANQPKIAELTNKPRKLKFFVFSLFEKQSLITSTVSKMPYKIAPFFGFSFLRQKKFFLFQMLSTFFETRSKSFIRFSSRFSYQV